MTIDTCFNCKHYLGSFSCLAFHEIPNEILEQGNPHTEILKGQDNSFTFVDKADKSFSYDDMVRIKEDE